jgi:hypothetical protein
MYMIFGGIMLAVGLLLGNALADAGIAPFSRNELAEGPTQAQKTLYRLPAQPQNYYDVIEADFSLLPLCDTPLGICDEDMDTDYLLLSKPHHTVPSADFDTLWWLGYPVAVG